MYIHVLLCIDRHIIVSKPVLWTTSPIPRLPYDAQRVVREHTVASLVAQHSDTNAGQLLTRVLRVPRVIPVEEKGINIPEPSWMTG